MPERNPTESSPHVKLSFVRFGDGLPSKAPNGRTVILRAPRINLWSGAVMVVIYVAIAGSLASTSVGLHPMAAAAIALPFLVAALWVLQRPFARLELHDRDLIERTVLTGRRIASLDEIVSVRITSRRAWWDGLKLFWTRYEFLDFELTSGERIETRRYWRYEADPVLGSDVTRAADELRSHLSETAQATPSC
jgi:hypothetical protein